MLKQEKKNRTETWYKRTAKLRVGYLKKINKIDNSLARLRKIEVSNNKNKKL